MSRTSIALAISALVLSQAFAQTSVPVSLTIYNQDFAVARTSVDLALQPGTNEVTTTEVTSQLEPDSVVLRDPSGKHAFSVVEQNYDAAIVTQDWLLQKYEGQAVDFQTSTFIDSKTHAQTPILVRGKILRANPPLVDVDGKMQFQLPGMPLFPASTNGLLLKPTLRWQFAGEAEITHIPRNEKVRFATGDAFDVTGKRTQTDFKVDTDHRSMDESFSIEVKNQKSEPVTVTVIEHLYRAANWEVTHNSADYTKRDSSTIEFPVAARPESSATITYTVHYTW
jgi:hypothetical protein